MTSNADELRCPDCGGRLNMVLHGGERQWYCPRAIGEQAKDETWGFLYIEQPSPHKQVIAWRASDAVISKQLDDARTYLRVGRERKSA